MFKSVFFSSFCIAKNLLLSGVVVLSLTSCQTGSTKSDSSQSGSSAAGSSGGANVGNPQISSGGTTTSASIDGKKTEKKIESKNSRVVPRGFDYSHPPEKIAFGSCANQDQPQPLWKTISAQNPELFIFMGDNIYASKPEQRPFAEQYTKLDKIPEYREIRSKIPFLAIWDDHDYGVNDAGRNNPDKESARKDFLNYWSYVRDSIGLNQGPLYHSKMLGGATVEKKRRRKMVTKNAPSVHVILLDTRWNRDDLVKNPDTSEGAKKYIPNTDPKASLLGETQWTWLEDELRKPADLTILVSSIQVIADDHGFEKWGNFPHEKEKLYNLIKKTQVKNLVVFSGDRHIGAIAKTEIKGWGTLYDITASSINMNKTPPLNEKDSSYVGDSYGSENFGLATLDFKKHKANFELKNLAGETVNSIELKLKP